MNREEIERKAKEYAMQFDEQYQVAMFKAWLDCAEWMQEQMQAEIRHLKSLVETQKATIDYNENQLSVLTEQLDAVHVFCEGVKEHYINKACKEFCHNCTHYENCEGYCDRYKHFFESMKGE